MKGLQHLESGAYNERLAQALKESGDFEQPTWVVFVKSGSHKQRPIAEPDFWFKRTASILRQIYQREIVGVGRLRTRYGGRKDRGVQPAEFRPAGGKIIRTILQQAEAAGLLEKATGLKAGRKLTQKGKDLLESIQ